MLQTNIRPLRAQDTDAVVGLLDRANGSEPGIGPVPPEMWRRFVAQPANLDGRDFRVAERGAALVGLATTSLKHQEERTVHLIRVIVDPAVRRRGIGSSLLAAVVPPAGPSADTWLQALVRSDWDAGLAFAARFGFAAIELEITMRATRLIAPRAASIDVTFERLDGPSRHASLLADLHNAAFRADAAFGQAEPQDFAERLGPGVKLMIAASGARVIGYCCLAVEPDVIWLDEVAVDPGFQGRGVGSALTFHALTELATDGRRAFGLNVSSANQAAQHIYRALGFAELRRTHRLAARAGDVGAILRGIRS